MLKNTIMIFFMIISVILCGNLSDSYIDKEIGSDIAGLSSFMRSIDNMEFSEKQKGFSIEYNNCIDGQERPFGLYIPDSYNRKEFHTLIVYLHGLVSRKEIMSKEEIMEYGDDWEIKEMADENNYIVIYPTGQKGALWWDSVGTDNILDQIRYVKENYNVNDDAVFMTGFSDGASASFYFAMCYPNEFAGFIPLNGHAGVANIDGKIQTYFQNLSQRPLHVINTDEDGLYPDKKMREMMHLAIEAGGDIDYKTYTGYGHDFDYVKFEIPFIAEFINSTRRPSFRSHVKWFTDNSNTRNRIDWLEITGIESDNPVPIEDIGDYNMQLPDDRIMLGFYSDYEFEGPGIKVDGIAGDSTLCSIMNIEAGDIFIKLDSFDIKTMDDMGRYKETKSRGDSTYVEVLRNGDTLRMKGAYPPVRYYPLFTRDNTTAYCEGVFIGNEYHINTVNTVSVCIYINAKYIDFKQSVKIFVNGNEKYNKKIEPDWGFALDNLKDSKDRKKLYIKKINIDI